MPMTTGPDIAAEIYFEQPTANIISSCQTDFISDP